MACLPSHDLLSAPNVYPAVHEHTKLPMVLVQVCEHPPLFVAHSFMSRVGFNILECWIKGAFIYV